MTFDSPVALPVLALGTDVFAIVPIHALSGDRRVI